MKQCIYCGETLPPRKRKICGKKECHNKLKAEHVKMHQKRLIEEGRCFICGNITDKPGKRCSSCRSKSKEQATNKREHARKTNTCVYCQTARRQEDSLYCARCSALVSLISQKSVKKCGVKRRIIICSKCGMEKPHKAHGLCASCYYKT